jgi:hypothetical protein
MISYGDRTKVSVRDELIYHILGLEPHLHKILAFFAGYEIGE